jgi:hypothetical protein
MKKLWNKIKAHFSGWPEGTSEGKKIKKDKELFKEEKMKTKQEGRKRVPVVKPKKIKGLNPKKKRVKKQ